MMIRLLGLLLCLLMCSFSYSQEQPDKEYESKKLEKFLYIGLGSGISMLDLKGTYFSVAPADLEGSQNIARHYTKYIQSIYFGYGRFMSKLYLGFEIDLSFYISGVNDRFDKGNYGFDITNQYKLGINGLVGVRTGKKSLLYTQLGLVYTDINVAADLLQPLTAPLNLRSFNFEESGAVHDWIGVVLGVGYSIPLNNKLSVKAIYNFTTYFAGNKYNNEKNDGEKTDYSFVDNRLSLGIAYRL